MHVGRVKSVTRRNISDNGRCYVAFSGILTAGGPNAQQHKFTAPKLTYMKVRNWPRTGPPNFDLTDRSKPRFSRWIIVYFNPRLHLALTTKQDCARHWMNNI